MKIENCKLKIVFFGTPDFAMPVLEALIKNGYDAYHFKSKTLKDGAVFEEFKNLKPDICVVAAYGKIIPKRYLDVPKYGFINVHPSLLPKYRGPSPVQTAILNGDTETGASIMMIDEEVDHGSVLVTAPYKIPISKYNVEIAEDLFRLGAELLIEILPKYLNGKIKPVEQNHSQATFTKMFQREDGRINWSESGDKIYNRIRALNPEPGTWTTWKGKVINILNITTSDVVSPQMPGMIVKIDDNIAVATKKCYLILKSIQLEGGKEMDAKSFVNGHPDFLNSILE